MTRQKCLDFLSQRFEEEEVKFINSSCSMINQFVNQYKSTVKSVSETSIQGIMSSAILGLNFGGS